ncbi:MAG: peptidylprolyl isomerase [Pseudomonadota bacterium]
MFSVVPQGAGAAADQPRVRMQTNMGDIVIELDRAKAPKSVENFLRYVNEGHYDGTIFHRVIPNFMVQGGGYNADFTQKSTHQPIENEANNGLINKRGTIAMARTNDPHSATAQFFINVVDNDFLNFTAPNPRGWGYTVFGTVVEGMDVADKIAKVATGSAGPFPSDAPRQKVVIEKVTLVGAAK